ncbi:MAG: phosphoglycerate dehydrogenase [Candidatus Lokiarchaeota archaeon]|nr:phosphoglycerate dehydrogenase [Candidatus Lokiarchaeota archaeon]
MNKVYIGSRTLTLNGHPALQKLEKAGLELVFGPPGKRPTEEDQLELVPGCIAYLAGTERISEKVLKSAKNLKIISRNGVGVNNIDLKAAKDLAIEVTITPGSNAQGVAELAITLMLTAVRSIPNQDKDLKNGKWNRLKGIEIEGKILGILGCGNIGKRVIKMALGLGMKVLGYDLYPDQSFNSSNDFKYVSQNEIFKLSDIISLHVPPGDIPIIDKQALSMMKDGVYIINTARGEVVDELELIEALNTNKVQSYATDVYKKEPPKIDELISHPRTICTPHIGAYTEESINRAVEAAIDNILRVLGLDVKN